VPSQRTGNDVSGASVDAEQPSVDASTAVAVPAAIGRARETHHELSMSLLTASAEQLTGVVSICMIPEKRVKHGSSAS